MPGARLTLEERQEIALGIARNGGRRRYRAVVAKIATRRRVFA